MAEVWMVAMPWGSEQGRSEVKHKIRLHHSSSSLMFQSNTTIWMCGSSTMKCVRWKIIVISELLLNKWCMTLFCLTITKTLTSQNWHVLKDVYALTEIRYVPFIDRHSGNTTSRAPAFCVIASIRGENWSKFICQPNISWGVHIILSIEFCKFNCSGIVYFVQAENKQEW